MELDFDSAKARLIAIKKELETGSIPFGQLQARIDESQKLEEICRKYIMGVKNSNSSLTTTPE